MNFLEEAEVGSVKKVVKRMMRSRKELCYFGGEGEDFSARAEW